MGRILPFIYSLIAWVMFLGLFVYLIGFLWEFVVPKTVNSGPEIPMTNAILINVFLIALFGIHHTLTARPAFKQRFLKHVPKHIERSHYVLASNILFFLILWQWQPIKQVIWHVENEALAIGLYALSGFGWFLVVASSFAINHFDLFGLRQAYLHLIGKEYTHVPIKVRFMYKWVRNPLMLGWFIGFWATPYMTVGHFVFAFGLTAYGLIGIYYEERSLASFHGEKYATYKAKTPMLFPIKGSKKG